MNPVRYSNWFICRFMSASVAPRAFSTTCGFKINSEMDTTILMNCWTQVSWDRRKSSHSWLQFFSTATNQMCIFVFKKQIIFLQNILNFQGRFMSLPQIERACWLDIFWICSLARPSAPDQMYFLLFTAKNLRSCRFVCSCYSVFVFAFDLILCFREKTAREIIWSLLPYYLFLVICFTLHSNFENDRIKFPHFLLMLRWNQLRLNWVFRFLKFLLISAQSLLLLLPWGRCTKVGYSLLLYIWSWESNRHNLISSSLSSPEHMNDACMAVTSPCFVIVWLVISENDFVS